MHYTLACIIFGGWKCLIVAI